MAVVVKSKRAPEGSVSQAAQVHSASHTRSRERHRWSVEIRFCCPSSDRRSRFAAKQQATSAELIDISMSQIIIGIEGEELTVDFPRVAQGVDDLRSVLVEMVKLAKGGYEHL